MTDVEIIGLPNRNADHSPQCMTLLAYPPAFGLPASTPFGLNTIMLLNMSAEPWQLEYLADPRKMPHQKLQIIPLDSAIIHDSENICLPLEERGARLKNGLDAREKAFAFALIRMSHKYMYFRTLIGRWESISVWSAVRLKVFTDIPRPEERLTKLEYDLQAISTLVVGGILFEEKPCAADASVTAILCAMMTAPNGSFWN